MASTILNEFINICLTLFLAQSMLFSNANEHNQIHIKVSL